MTAKRSPTQRLRPATMRAAAFLVLILSLLVSNPAATEPSVRGRWVLLQVLTTKATVPVVGSIYAKTTIISLMKVKQKGKRLKGRGKLCKIELDSGNILIDTILPAAFVKSLAPPKFNFGLKKKAGTWHLRQRPEFVVVGAKLKNKKTDPMPKTAKDKRVFDQDGDGKPGVTIRIEGIVSGEIYVAQRNWTLMSGTRVSSREYKGGVEFGNEQVILGATSSMLKDPPKTRAIAKKSYFRMVKVKPDFGCDEAVKMATAWDDD